MTIEIDGVNNTLKTDKIEPQSGTALQVGASGDTVTLPSGATLNIAGTITNSGTATGFGSIDWQTSDVKTGNFTAAAGKGYLVNTTSGAVTVSLPAGSAGTQIGIADYAGTWATNGCLLSANGSEKIETSTDTVLLNTNREAVVILYQDSTQGWISVSNSDGALAAPTYISATGGTITTSGDYKIHTFNSSGTFTVSSVGNSVGGGDTVAYKVLAGAGGGGGSQSNNRGGGGGGGGYREGKPSDDPYSTSPLSAPTGLTVSAQAYPITVGSGGSGGTGQPSTPNTNQIAPSGANSIFSTITSAGGGGGGGGSPPGNGTVFPGVAGGSGGGGGGGGSGPGTCARGGGGGNSPPVSPPQGSKGGAGGTHPGNPGSGDNGGGGGGGALCRGGMTGSDTGGPGGNGTGTSITGANVNQAGGGAARGLSGDGSSATGGVANGNNGTSNAGAGGPGGAAPGGGGWNGGSGQVIVRYKYQN
jgi:hypothetical protein